MRALLALMLLTGTAHAGCNDKLLAFGEWSVVPLGYDQVQMSVAFKSNADKPITMINAKAGYVDALGHPVVSFHLDKDVEIPAGGTYAEVKNYDRGPFERMLILKHAEVATFVCVEGVLYGDGTKQAF
ncbi:MULTISPECIES: hypothetical protein [unclassified Mesorhizobium]|uniref:hypothetical protein n=1 Tax=unclassified Mesorhizobium TaxID=325217 RepID=UPI0003CF22A6|nr:MULTISPECIES: hypothetical protein [unclassified Mesorhizobium]ESY49035.1 hypothetical protein X745_28060 [Mesorhizobium sp. LNJC374B00]ESY52727.1 hypothetical protein X744_28540 [Mesorhizobium sp. LNJC372A00]WJI81450.1 hypothetical protein NLY34_01430 [Mesorhizobium sp. C374B]WJI87969.1 hypothetical protein NLY42_03845 [Mesorhizobium sp. C372A]